MLRYGEVLDKQQMPSEGAATGAFSAETQPQGSPVWPTEQKPPTTTNLTSVTGPSSHPALPPSAAIKTNIVCLPPESTTSCTTMECSPVVDQHHVSNAVGGAAFSGAPFGANQGPASGPATTAVVTPESSSVSLQQFEDAPEDDQAQYCHLPHLDPHAEGPESRLQPRSQHDGNLLETVELPQRPLMQKQQRQSSLDALAMVCDFENRATPSSANVAVPSAASSTYSASMSLGTNDQEDTGTISSASTQVMSNTSFPAETTPKTSSSNRREDTFAGADSSVPSSSTGNFQFSHSDVLCGRGGLTNHHPGNVLFRKLVRSKQEEYLRATKRDKAGVAREIVDTIRRLDPPGRFLKKDPSNPGQWVEIGNRKAREKTSQALREGAPELREELNEAAAANNQQSQQQTRQQQQSNLFLAPHTTTVTCEGMTLTDTMAGPPALRGRKVTEEGPAVAAALAEAMSSPPEQAQLEQQPPQIFPQGYVHAAPPSDAGPHHIYDETASQPQSANVAVPMDTSTSSSSGNKRKFDEEDQYTQARRSPMPEACAIQEHRAHEDHDQRQEEPCPSPGGTRGKGGPRIKMLKDRMRDFPCVQ